MIDDTTFTYFLPKIKQLIHQETFEKNDFLTNQFLLEQENNLTMYYAPHNEYVNTQATIIIVGITPGWQQMKTAYREIIQSLRQQEQTDIMLKKAKIAASFSGQMRNNLTKMLDDCGLAKALVIDSTATLFTTHRSLLHTTSVIKYPVFYKGKNYTGHTPSIERSPLLKKYAYSVFPTELMQIERASLIIPLGKATEQVLHHVQKQTPLHKHTYLFGFPHPSGANGHRLQQFRQQQQQLEKNINFWQNQLKSH